MPISPALLLVLTFLSLTISTSAISHPARVALSARRPSAFNSLLQRRTIGPSNITLDNFVFGGVSIQWYGNISVGTPPQQIPVVFDTGSTTLEFASDLCDSSCDHQTHFITKSSSTFVAGEVTQTLNFTTGSGNDPVSATNIYSLTLQNAMDVVSVGGLDAGRMDFYTITNQSPTFEKDPFSGIQGMGSTAGGVFASLEAQGLPSLFSLYIPNISDGELTIGGIDNSKFTDPLEYIQLSKLFPLNDGWVVDLHNISVNGETSASLNTIHPVLLDSGTSNMVFPTALATAIYALISPNIVPHGSAGAYGIACSKISSLTTTIDLTFISTTNNSPFNLTIPSSEFNLGPFSDDPTNTTCQTMINALDNDILLVGASLFKHYYTVWDLGGQQVGFSPAVSPSEVVSNTKTASFGTQPTQSIKSGVMQRYSKASELVITLIVVIAVCL